MELIRRETDYALRALVAMAQEGGFVHTRRIARLQKMPFDFLQKIMGKLKRAGLVRMRRGSRGGCALADAAADAALLTVIEAVQGELAVNRCFLRRGKCPRQRDCPVREKLGKVQEAMRSLLAQVKLGELLGRAAGRRGQMEVHSCTALDRTGGT